MSPGVDTYEQLNVSECCYLSVHCISTRPKCQAPRHKIPTDPPQISAPPDKYSQVLDINRRTSYSVFTSLRSVLMSVAYQQAQKVRYRITLDISAFPDFDPHQIDWEKLFKLEPAEKCEAYVEDLSTPDRW